MKPAELDLNLEALRASAIGKLLDAVRAALGHCDDIEAMARVLHSQAAIKVQAQVGSHANGNGNGTRAPRQLLPRPRHYQRTNRARLLEAALPLVDASGPEGIDSVTLESRLRGSGVVPPGITIASARAAINDALRAAAGDHRIRAYRTSGRTGRCYYVPLAASASTAVSSPVSPPMTEIVRLREFLIATLIGQTAPVSVTVLHKAAIELAGFNLKWGRGDTLSNQINRIMREMTMEGRVKRFGKGRHNEGGKPFTYAIFRPKVSVSKHATESARATAG